MPTGGISVILQSHQNYNNGSALVNKWTSRSASVARGKDTLVTVEDNGLGELFLLHLSQAAIGRQLMAMRTKGEHSQFVYYALPMRRQRMITLANSRIFPYGCFGVRHYCSPS